MNEGERLVGIIRRGNAGIVEDVGPASLRVRWSTGAGWISKADVMPLDEALSYFAGLVKDNPASVADLLGYGNARLYKHDYDGAIPLLTKVIGLDPDKCHAYVNRGQALAAIGDSKGAIGDYSEVIRLDPKFADAYRLRGVAYNNSGEYGKASRTSTPE